jgi:hypothetical protein
MVIMKPIVPQHGHLKPDAATVHGTEQLIRPVGIEIIDAKERVDTRPDPMVKVGAATYDKMVMRRRKPAWNASQALAAGQRLRKHAEQRRDRCRPLGGPRSESG